MNRGETFENLYSSKVNRSEQDNGGSELILVHTSSPGEGNGTAAAGTRPNTPRPNTRLAVPLPPLLYKFQSSGEQKSLVSEVRPRNELTLDPQMCCLTLEGLKRVAVYSALFLEVIYKIFSHRELQREDRLGALY